MNPPGSFGVRLASPGRLYYGDANWQFSKDGFVVDREDQMTGAEWENIQARINSSTVAVRASAELTEAREG
jgi:hypothetical protein